MINLDIKSDSIFKIIFKSESGRKYMAKIISILLKIDYNELIKYMYIYNTEYSRKDNASSYSDVVYKYKNKIIILEMNNQYSEKSIHKNHFYLFFNHILESSNINNYKSKYETYLIDIDNYDIVDKIKVDMKKEFIYESKLFVKDTLVSILPNIKT